MITLQPPPERDLPVRRNAEIWAAVLRVAAPAPPRRTRWVIAVAAVLVLVIAAVGIPRLLAGPDVAVPVATPSAVVSPSTPTPSSTPPPGRAVDRGPLDRTDREALITRCQQGLRRYVPVQEVLFARATVDGSAVLVRDRDGSVYGCSDGGSSLLAGPDSKSEQLPAASADRPVRSLSGPARYGSASAHRYAIQAGDGWWAVSPAVAVVQVRIRHDGDAGAWFDAAIHGGFAYGAATADFTIDSLPTGPRDGVTVEVRAYDREGGALSIDGER